MALGVYPEITLATARDMHQKARELVAQNIDPAIYKKMQTEKRQVEASNSFEAIANEWYIKFSEQWSKTHKERVLAILQRDAFPYIGKRPISEIEPPEILHICNRVVDRGATYTAHKTKQICGQVFRYAVATGRAVRDPTPDLKGALPPTVTKHMAAITDPIKVGELMRAIYGYSGHYETCNALKLLPLVFTRPGELRKTEWSEINFEKAIWTIPKEKMKRGRQHKIPLSKQAIEILQDIQPLTGKWKYISPVPVPVKNP